MNAIEAARPLLGRAAQLVAIAITILGCVTFALGFRLEKPGARLESLEGRVTTLEKSNADFNTAIQTVIRLQCLTMSRRDADLANACKLYPTREESTRVVR